MYESIDDASACFSRLKLTHQFESSDDESSFTESDHPAKRPRSMFSLGGTTDRSNTDHSLPDDDFQLSDDDDGSFQRADKKLMESLVKHAEPSSYVDNKAKKMMERMGYKAGHGLGKHAQGRVHPVEMSRQRGRRGLGLHIEGLEAATLKWDSSLEVISVEETVSWLEELDHKSLTQKDFKNWLKEGPKKLTIDDETNFCDPSLLRNVLTSKSVFDRLEPEELRKARTKSDPFKTIRGGFFLNQTAMKMANMDRVFDFMFTRPKDEHDEDMLGPNDLLYFADVCAGPGGFSEYVLWRKQWKAKGFGFTLKGQNDFRLGNFCAGPCETFEPHYGMNGADGDGDIFNPDNISEFTRFVMDQTHRNGVHFMMADGDFSVDGQENIQEILSKQLYLCQFLVSLFIVRVGGNFVCKVFDLFTPFSVGLVYLLYKSYRKISIHKPNTSHPANSERYIICKWKRKDSDAIADYLYYVNKLLWNFGRHSSQENQDVVQVVPLNVLTSDTNFFEYIIRSNNSLGERQVVNLVKIAAFCRDINLLETRQADIKKKCLRYWEVPDKARTAPPRVVPDVKCEEILRRSTTKTLGVLHARESEFKPESLDEEFKSIYDWHCMVVGSVRDRRNFSFFLGLGRKNVYRYSGTRWVKVDEKIELSPDTLLYGEMVLELSGEGRTQHKMATLHIIDALCLGGIDISTKHLTERHRLCRKFAEALNKATVKELTPIRVKELYDMELVDQIFDRLDQRMIKNAGGQHRLVYNLEVDGRRFFLPGGLLFMKATQDPWMRHQSRKNGYKYYYSPHEAESKYDRDRPKDACSSFPECFKNRKIWWWEEGVKVHDVHPAQPGKLHRDQLVTYIHSKCVRPAH